MIPLMTAESIDPGKMKMFFISDFTLDESFDQLIVKTESPIKSPADLGGKKIGIFPGTTQRSILKKYLTDKGVDISKTTFIELPPQNQLAALWQGSIDVLQSIEPNRTIAIESGNARAINVSAYAETYNHTPFATGVVTSAFVQNHPDLAKKTVEVLKEGNTYLSANEADTRTIAGKAMNLEKNIQDKVSMQEYVGIDEDNVSRFADFLIQIGELKTKPDVSQMFYK